MTATATKRIDTKARQKRKDRADRLHHDQDEIDEAERAIVEALDKVRRLRDDRNRLIAENAQAEQIYAELIAEAPELPREPELEKEIAELHNRIRNNDLKDKKYRKPLTTERAHLQELFRERDRLQDLKVLPCGGVTSSESQAREN